MSELGTASIIALAGFVVGIGSVFSSMLFLPTLFKRFGIVTIINPPNYERQVPGYLPINAEPLTGIQSMQNATLEPESIIRSSEENNQVISGVEINTKSQNMQTVVASAQHSGEKLIVEQNSSKVNGANQVVDKGFSSDSLREARQTKMDLRVERENVDEQDNISPELLAAIVATLCTMGLKQNECYQIKQVRQVN